MLLSVNIQRLKCIFLSFARNLSHRIKNQTQTLNESQDLLWCKLLLVVKTNGAHVHATWFQVQSLRDHQVQKYRKKWERGRRSYDRTPFPFCSHSIKVRRNVGDVFCIMWTCFELIEKIVSRILEHLNTCLHIFFYKEAEPFLLTVEASTCKTTHTKTHSRGQMFIKDIPMLSDLSTLSVQLYTVIW